MPTTTMKIPLLGQFFTTRHPAVHADTCINYYPETITKEDNSIDPQKEPDVVLYPTPGLVSACTVGASSGAQVRGMVAYNGYIWVVVGSGFYQCTQNLTTGALTPGSVLGTISTTTGPVSIVTSGALSQQFLITDGTSSKYYYNFGTTTFGAVTDVSAVVTDQAAYQDGYAVICSKGTNVWYISNVEDLSTFNALNFASTTSRGDNLVAAVFFKQYLCLFTTGYAETWYNAGTVTITGQTTSFPYSRVADVYIDKGLASPFGVVLLDTALIWYTQNEHGQSVIVRAGGTLVLVPTIISTPAICSLIDSTMPLYQAAGVAKGSDCQAYCYTEVGHEFVVFTFPIGNLTIVYDNTSKMWHQWASGTLSNLTGQTTYGRHLSNCHAYLNGYHYVGDYNSYNIYNMSSNYYTDNGTPIMRERTSSYVSNNLDRLSIPKVELDVTGNGTITLYTSKDGGSTFVSQGAQTMGVTGAYLTRVFWTLLGYARTWCFKLVTSTTNNHVLIRGTADIDEGDTAGGQK